MSDLRHYPFISHLRAEPTSHIVRFKNGSIVSAAPGDAFWFRRLSTTVAEIPIEDREQGFIFTGRSADFQDVSVQGAITYRVADPIAAMKRIDFAIDLETGLYLEEPIERLAQTVTQVAQQTALDWIAHRTLDSVLVDAVQGLRPLLATALRDDEALADLGLEVVTVHLTRISPTPDLEKALQAPTRERLQESADEATFQRRAQAVEKERAIAENELANQVELAKREEELITQRGVNERRRVENEADALRIESAAKVDRLRLQNEAHAEGITTIEQANNNAEQGRIDIYREVPSQVLLGLAARELAGKLERIDHLNLGADGLGSLMESFLMASTARIES